MAGPSGVRVDKWLWSVRVFRTRTSASDACSAGRVMVNGEQAKPATKVVIDDVVEARRRERIFIYTVKQLIEKRVSASKAADCFEDRSPQPQPRSAAELPPPGGARERGSGRPTKRERREIDRLRGRP
ncbi:MAG: RNA-binding S4 domain-containing protein [Acidimicrobiales bacterium]